MKGHRWHAGYIGQSESASLSARSRSAGCGAHPVAVVGGCGVKPDCIYGWHIDDDRERSKNTSPTKLHRNLEGDRTAEGVSHEHHGLAPWNYSLDLRHMVCRHGLHRNSLPPNHLHRFPTVRLMTDCGDAEVRDEKSALKLKRKSLATFRKGNLIMFRRRGEYIAGKLITYKDGIPYMTHTGVRDGRMDLIDEGAIGATNEFTLRYLKNKGHQDVHFGQSRGFLNDRVHQFKKKYGRKVVGKSDHKFLLKITSDARATRAFLQNNPFIFVHMGELHGAAFLSDQLPLTQQVLERFKKQLSQAGLAQLIPFLFRQGKRSQSMKWQTPHHQTDPDRKATNTYLR